MKLQLQSGEGLNSITAYGERFVLVNGVRYQRGLAVLPNLILDPWAEAGFAALSAADLAALLAHKPEIVLLGTGATLRFPAAEVLRPLIEAGIGYEVMDLGAACRTYNVLIAEGRHVVAALLLD